MIGCDTRAMTGMGSGRRRGTYRRVRSWAKHTPNGEIALTLISIGAVLLVLAVIAALVLL